MNHDDLKQWTARAADWIAQYHDQLRQRPVRPDVQPGQTAALLPDTAPDAPEAIETIFEDFERIVPGAMTHWQHPRFFAYFPANASPASMLAEQLANAIAAQCMLWQTSPAATELEGVMVRWLRDAMGLAPHFTGTIHDTATTATLCAVLTMRERATGFEGNQRGMSAFGALRVYASDQCHSSIDKAVRLAGIGQDNLVKVPTGDDLAMDPQALRQAIAADRAAGLTPAGVVLCIGGTSVGASDHIAPLIQVARDEDLYTHVDAAWAGSAMICPELRHVWEGADEADSIVFNPHKWLGVQFDCSVQFLADPKPQVQTLGLRPDYLKTLGRTEVVNYNEWTVPLGRRFRALKLWFVLRAYGLDGLRAMIRNHIAWAEALADRLETLPDIDIVTRSPFGLFSFQHSPQGADPNAATAALIERINNDGRVYLTQTTHQGRFVIRVSVGSFGCTQEDVMEVHNVVRELTA